MGRSFVLCGLGRTGSRVLYYLRAAGLPVVVVDNRCRPDDPRLHGATLVSGDCRDGEALRKAGVVGSRGVLVMTDDDLVNVSTTLQVRALDEKVRIVVRMFDQNLLVRLGQTIENVYALSTALLTAPVLAATATTGAALGAFSFAPGPYAASLRSPATGSSAGGSFAPGPCAGGLDGPAEGRRLVAESVVAPGDDLGGRTIAEVVEPRGAVCLAHLPGDDKERILGDVDPQRRLKPGDRLVLCGERRALAPVIGGPSGGVEDHDLRWAGWLRRMFRVCRRTLQDMEPAVVICTAVVAVVLLVSTLVLHLGVTRYTVPDALLRTVSIMATGASLHEEDYKDLPRIRVFVSVLRILGAVLLAAFTALVTNYLLRARLGGAFEVRRIPESGHVVVCGLGSIGFQTVKELMQSGERVVVIETDPANPFILAARRLGAAVIVGDATLPEVQAQARMTSAFSVIVATSNDVSNLSVALLVREKQPAQRVVVLISDPQMAEMLRKAAKVELAVSVPLLAAPAFLAALFGDRVLTVVMVTRHLLAVLDLEIHADGPLAGRPLAEAARRYRFCPIAVLPAGGAKAEKQELAAGDRLVAVLRVADLEALMRPRPTQ
jgi:Trk K+ transport system NAD-binding subunit